MPAAWLEAARDLEIGQTRRIEHDCGQGKALLISRSDRGYSAYCFRCPDGQNKLFHPADPEPLAVRIARLKARREAEERVTTSCALPSPREYNLREWPEPAVGWLLKAGLGAQEIKDLGAYYTKTLGRVVIPVREGGHDVFWIARSIDGTLPKYLCPTQGRQDIVAKYGHDGGPPVLTEDILSAYKISLAGYTSWCLLGTKATDKLVARLIKRGKGAIAWLDPDWKVKNKPGQANAAKLIRRLNLLGVPTVNVLSGADPKNHTRKEIQDYVSTALSSLQGRLPQPE